MRSVTRPQHETVETDKQFQVPNILAFDLSSPFVTDNIDNDKEPLCKLSSLCSFITMHYRQKRQLHRRTPAVSTVLHPVTIFISIPSINLAPNSLSRSPHPPLSPHHPPSMPGVSSQTSCGGAGGRQALHCPTYHAPLMGSVACTQHEIVECRQTNPKLSNRCSVISIRHTKHQQQRLRPTSAVDDHPAFPSSPLSTPIPTPPPSLSPPFHARCVLPNVMGSVACTQHQIVECRQTNGTNLKLSSFCPVIIIRHRQHRQRGQRPTSAVDDVMDPVTICISIFSTTPILPPSPSPLPPSPPRPGVSSQTKTAQAFALSLPFAIDNIDIYKEPLLQPMKCCIQ